MNIDQRIKALRERMHTHSIDAIIIPGNDPHQSEYVSDHWKCREWISGFTGSAGTVVVTLQHAGLWTDSRYFLQAEKELNDSEFVLHKVMNYAPDFIPFLLEKLDAGSMVSCDAHVFSQSEIEKYGLEFDRKNIKLVTKYDLIGEIWSDRPDIPLSKLLIHEEKYAGKSVAEKLGVIRAKCKEAKSDQYLLTALDDIAWTFNLRGRDIESNPVFIAYALIREKDAILFVDDRKLTPEIESFLHSAGVLCKGYFEIADFLKTLDTDIRLYFSMAGINRKLYESIPCKKLTGNSIVGNLKAIKNEIEIAQWKKAMEKDAVALTRLYIWLEKKLESGTVTECELAKKLAGFRSQQEGYFGESFTAIVGYESNGAIIHYSPVPETCATIKKEGILLLDSGGQYVDGTTDITRTTALGEASAEQKTHFTLVLKGHIALDELQFPEGTNGYQLDAFARQYLWKYGLNYFHGTGHGVGFFLNVHEGPQGISFVLNDRTKTALVPGMVSSNEPGFYKDGAYGIRIENLVLTTLGKKSDFGQFLKHETLTLFPIDLGLIDFSMLTRGEINWINDYHRKVFSRVSGRLNEEEKGWLKAKCAQIELFST